MEKLDALHERMRRCLSCPLGRPEGLQSDGTMSFHVPGEGPADARIIIVGEAPGAEEDRTGRPFIGRSGALLTEILSAAGLDRKKIFITSVCKCRPPKNRTPKAPEIESCMSWLSQQLEMIRPEFVLTVGNVPTQTLLGTKTGISSLRGRFHDFMWNGRTMTLRPLFHPAYLLRNPRRVPGSPWDLMLHDLMEVREAMNRE